jgi:8-oxo-dGTP pyrophosphatase MutT (NUDIX family)
MLSPEEMRQQAEDTLRRITAQTLPPAVADHTKRAGDIRKAGLLPFYVREDASLLFYLYKPRPRKDSDLPPPKFQIPKGTREAVGDDGIWQDYHPGHKHHYTTIEPLHITALREAIEEVGLRVKHLEQLYDAGIVNFTSETTGAPKSLWLFCGQLNSQHAFDTPHDERANTESCAWFDIATPADAEQIRPDHLKILLDIKERLTQTG